MRIGQGPKYSESSGVRSSHCFRITANLGVPKVDGSINNPRLDADIGALGCAANA